MPNEMDQKIKRTQIANTSNSKVGIITYLSNISETIKGHCE